MADKIASFGLLFMTVSANYTGNLFSCDIQRELTQNLFAKHIVCFSLLLFFVVITNKDSYVKDAVTGKYIIPQMLIDTALIYMIFVITSKMEFLYTASIVLLMATYMLIDLEKVNKSDETKETIDNIKQMCKWLMIALASVGFVKYYIKQSNDHGDDFSIFRFLLGTNKCRDI